MKKLILLFLISLAIQTITLAGPCDSFDVQVYYDTTACTGDQSTFWIEVTGGTGPYIYTWHYNDMDNIPVILDSVPHYSDSFTEQDSAYFYVSVEDTTTGCVFEHQFMTFDASNCIGACDSFQVTYAIPDGSFCEGDTFGFNVAVIHGTAPYTFQWYYGDVAHLPDTNTSGFFSEYFMFEDSTLLYLVLRDSLGCEFSYEISTIADSSCDSSSAAIHHINNFENLQFYPNPVNTSLFIKWEEVKPGSVLMLSNNLGEVVKTIKLSRMITSVDVSGLKSGFYMATIVYKNQTIHAQKIAVDRF